MKGIRSRTLLHFPWFSDQPNQGFGVLIFKFSFLWKNYDGDFIEFAGPESHGVHLCHKCGWPFPNPHPSAKHRRAHKRVCGSVEGFKLDRSEGSNHSAVTDDDEPHSDDDHKSPSKNYSFLYPFYYFVWFPGY